MKIAIDVRQNLGNSYGNNVQKAKKNLAEREQSR